MTVIPSPFSRALGHFQYAWDSTSYRNLKTCPRKYQLSIIEGYQPKVPAWSLLFGIAFHKCMEYRTHLKMNEPDLPHEEFLRKIARYTLEQAVVLKDGPNNRKPAALLRAVIWYCEHHREDVLHTVQLSNGKPAAELSFRLALDFGFPIDESILYCGHIDRLARFGTSSGVYVIDYKTTAGQLSQSYFEDFSPDDQMTGYTIAAKTYYEQKIDGVLIDAVQTGVTFARLERGFVPRTEDQLNEWLAELRIWIGQAFEYAKSNYWPMNQTACNHYGGCQFKSVCRLSPEFRDAELEANFERRFWNPLQSR